MDGESVRKATHARDHGVVRMNQKGFCEVAVLVTLVVWDGAIPFE
jgi:hypothetical protein